MAQYVTYFQISKNFMKCCAINFITPFVHLHHPKQVQQDVELCTTLNIFFAFLDQPSKRSRMGISNDNHSSDKLHHEKSILLVFMHLIQAVTIPAFKWTVQASHPTLDESEDKQLRLSIELRGIIHPQWGPSHNWFRFRAPKEGSSLSHTIHAAQKRITRTFKFLHNKKPVA